MSSQTTTPSEQVRDALKRVQDEAAEMREQRAQAKKDRDAAKATFARDPSERNYERAQMAAGRVEEFDERIEEKRAEEMRLLHTVSTGNGNGAAALGGLLGLGDLDLAQADELRQLAHSNARLGGERLLGTIDRDKVAGWLGLGRGLASTTTPSGVQPTPGMTRTDQRGAIAYPTPPTALLDLIPAGTTDTSTVEFAAEVRVDDGDVDVVEPGQIKPQVAIEWQDRTSATATIAGWVKAQRQSLADIGYLQAAIQGRLLVRLRQRLEAEVLNGDGETSDRGDVPGIVGLLRTNGVASIPAGGGDLLDRILDAIVAVQASGGTANVCALALADWADIARSKDESGAYVFPPATVQQQAWGLTFTPSTALDAGQAVVADSRAMQLLVREAAQVRVGEESDDMVRNRLTLLAEMRAAFVVWQPALVALIESD
jgi:hypothetical protein